MAELVTGEAVALDIRVARLASRAMALLLDVLVQFALLNALFSLTSMTALIADEAWTAGLSILTTVVVVIGYPASMETLTRGRTLGKMALGLRVVGDDGGPVRFRQALVRALAGFVEFWLLFGSPALIASLFNRRSKRLGDIFAGTIVMQDRVPTSALFGPVAVMPPQLAGWGRSLEISRLPDDLALTARQYLTRFWELLPEVRDAMGRRIAGQVLAVVSPPPPAGFRPEILLSAVLAERRRREEWRLHQRGQRRMALLRRSLADAPVTGVFGAVPPGGMPHAAAPAAPPQPPPLSPPPLSPPPLSPPPLSPPSPGRPQFLPPVSYGAGPYQHVFPGGGDPGHDPHS
jgi:uncharacterized RDD family membrane protein YckC